MSYYFIPEPQREGTCYYEFYAGPWHRRKMEFWREDSIVISDLNFSFTGLEKLIAQVIPCFDAYGKAVVSWHWQSAKPSPGCRIIFKSTTFSPSWVYNAAEQNNLLRFYFSRFPFACIYQRHMKAA